MLSRNGRRKAETGLGEKVWSPRREKLWRDVFSNYRLSGHLC